MLGESERTLVIDFDSHLTLPLGHRTNGLTGEMYGLHPSPGRPVRSGPARGGESELTALRSQDHGDLASTHAEVL